MSFARKPIGRDRCQWAAEVFLRRSSGVRAPSGEYYARARWRCTIHSPLVASWDVVQTPRPPSPAHPSPSPRAAPGAASVASQLSRASVAYFMRPRHPSTVIWIYTTYALLSTSSSRICGFSKSSKSINGLYCKVLQGTSFVRSALEFLIWQTVARRRVRHMAS